MNLKKEDTLVIACHVQYHGDWDHEEHVMVIPVHKVVSKYVWSQGTGTAVMKMRFQFLLLVRAPVGWEGAAKNQLLIHDHMI